MKKRTRRTESVLLYTLSESGQPVPAPDMLTWLEWMENEGIRLVARTSVGRSVVLTSFLAVNHQYGSGAPILWETKVAGGEMSGEITRCAGGREQAEAMHAEIVARLHASRNKPRHAR